jgi:hypothetical protein
MKNFVKVELGCRGEVENVELVKTSYELIEDEYDDKYSDLESDFDNIEYLEEFASINIDEEKGEVEYGFSEEDCTFYVEYDKNVELCDGLLKCWDNEDLENELYELIGNLGC